MKSLCILFICLLAKQSLARDVDQDLEQPKAHMNLVSMFINHILTSLEKNNLKIPEINLGKEVGKISDAELAVAGGLTKEVEGLSDFGFKLNTTLKNIFVNAQYDLKNLSIPGLFPVYGNGNADIRIEMVRLAIDLSVKYVLVGDLFQFKLGRTSVAVGTTKVKLDNLMNDPNITKFLNELIGNLVPEIVVMIDGVLQPVIQEFLDTYGNGVFGCIKNEFDTLAQCLEEVFKKKPFQLNELLQTVKLLN